MADEGANESDFVGGYKLVKRAGAGARDDDDDDDDDGGAREEDVPGVRKAKQASSYAEKGRARLAALLSVELAGMDGAAPAPAPVPAPVKKRKWDQEPTPAPAAPPPAPAPSAPAASGGRRSRWDQPPAASGTEPPAEPAKRSRWDQRPPEASSAPNTTSTSTSTSTSTTTLATTTTTALEVGDRALTDAELDALLPSEGYEIVEPPADYDRRGEDERRALLGEKDASDAQPAGFAIQTTKPVESYGVSLLKPETEAGAGPGALPMIRPQDMPFFGKLMEKGDAEEDTPERANERNIMQLLLKIKNGVPATRKAAMRQITDDAPRLGAGPLFQQLLPLLMSPSLEQQERHLLVKVVDRILLRLADMVRPWANKILAVIEPLLMDDDYVARLEGREIIANLAKAVGFETMIRIMRPDIDNEDDFVRNVTARALAVVASALGVPSMLTFLRLVCRSKKSWEARHTGIKAVQQIASLLGCGVLPHLTDLVECVSVGLRDEQLKVRTMTALALASLAEAAHPYGYESFAPVLEDVWDGLAKQRGKGLSAFIRAIGFIIPLMDEDDALRAAQRVMPVLVREFKSPDEETRKIVLRALKQCATTEGVTPTFLRESALDPFFEAYWIRRSALDRRNHEPLVDTTLTLAGRIGPSFILAKLAPALKDESEPFRHLALDAVERVMRTHGVVDVNERLEETLVDGALFAFHEQQALDSMDVAAAGSSMAAAGAAVLRGFVGVVTALGARAKPYVGQIASVCRGRLQHKNPPVRMQAADAISGLAPAMRLCHEEELLCNLGVVLAENLGEEFPDVLGSILKALNAVLVNVGVERMTPPVGDLLPRLTPILKNPSDKVAEALIDLVGRIADVGASHVSAREWMRVCFDLIEMLRSPRMGIRRAAANTFGFIARAVGPQDVLHTLLNNLRVQDRQMRVCTTVAVAIVAEQCAPFTVLPALLNEYRTPDVNVQNGVLKAVSFLTQYIGPMATDYIYTFVPLLQHALSDRDHVHRQTACDAVKHLALSCAGRGCEDSLTHLLNYVFPNIFEQSPHVHRAVVEAIEALRVGLGAGVVLSYVLPGMFHPARFVRQTYWRMYNNLYVYDSDALVPFYPRMDEVPVVVAVVEDEAGEGAGEEDGGVKRARLHHQQRFVVSAHEDELEGSNDEPEVVVLAKHMAKERAALLRRTYLELFV